MLKIKIHYLWMLIFVLLISCTNTTIKSSENISNSSSLNTIQVTNIDLISNRSEIEIDEVLQLEYQIEPSNASNKNVVFSSSDTNIASVSKQGIVKGISEGNVTITVSTEDGNHSDSIELNVISNKAKIENITILNKIDFLYQDEKYKLIYETIPNDFSNKNLVFTSSIPSIASIDQNGEITARLPGTTTIKVSSLDGKKYDSFELTIKKKIIHVEKVELSADKTSLVEGETIQLIVNITPDNASNKNIRFTSQNPDYLEVDNNGVVKALKPTPNGVNATIKVTTEDQDKTDEIGFIVIPKVVSVENISISLISENIIPGDEIKYIVNILPVNADDKTYTLSTSTTDILSINNNKVIALKEGLGKLTVTSNDGNKQFTIDVPVSKTSTYSEIKSMLDTSLTIEKETSNSGMYNYSTNGLIESSSLITWTTYQDAIQKKETTNDDVITTLVYRDENNLINLQDSKINNVSINSYSIGNESNQYNESEVNDRLSLVELSNSIGLSSLLKSLLDDTSSFNMSTEIDVINELRILVNNETNYTIIYITKNCEYKNSLFDSNYKFMRLNATIKFNLDSSLDSFEYKVEKFDSSVYNQETHTLNDNALPASIEECSAKLNYGSRLLSDETRISKDDYKVLSFDIDTTNFENNGVNTIYLGENKNINLINIIPSNHLKPLYSLEIDDETILMDSSYGNMLSIKGLKLGTTTVKVYTDDGVENSFKVTVVIPPVQSISINYINPLIYEGDSFIISASVYPNEALDKDYTIEIKGSDTTIASLIRNANGTYTFTALKEGSITIVAYANSDNSIMDEETINIKKKANENSIKNYMCASPYTTTDTTLIFNEDGTGSLVLQGGGKYTFNWEVNSSLEIIFSNVLTTKKPDRWYNFTGAKGSYLTDNNAQRINLIIYDLDENCNISLQLSN